MSTRKSRSKNKKVTGILARIDCQGTQATLVVQNGRSMTRLLVVDPGAIAIGGGGERSLACGAQKAQRKVEVEYEPGTMKKVTRIEFR